MKPLFIKPLFIKYLFIRQSSITRLFNRQIFLRYLPVRQVIALLFSVICLSTAYAQSLNQSLNALKDHFDGSDVMSDSELVAVQSAVQQSASGFATNANLIELGFDVIELHDNANGPLFTQGSSTSNGIRPRTKSGFDEERAIAAVMQGILDFAYTENNLKAFPSIFSNTKFDSSDHFPGAVSPPNNSNQTHTVTVHASNVRFSGAPDNGIEVDARRPTGTYLAPGSIAEVTVPASLVNKGATILVGSHTWDLTSRPNFLRLDRISKTYNITSQTVTVGNPMGGGIYINIPIDMDAGNVQISIKNVIRSPYYADTPANKTTLAEWQQEERNHPAPFADFETERVMLNIPTAWIYAMDDPSEGLDDWGIALDAISEFLARPKVRNKTPLYAQVDLQLRSHAFFPGYPQSNVIFDPNQNYNGDQDHYLLNGPREASRAITTLFHEHGHQERIYKFTGEIEAIVNLLAVPAYQSLGMNLEEAFQLSLPNNVNLTLDQAAMSWLVAENFRLGNPMSPQTGQFRQEFAYQSRGYAKYVEIMRLFGTEVITRYHESVNERFEANTITTNFNNVPANTRILNFSIAAEVDLRPLFEFWGIHPQDRSALANDISNAELPASALIYDQLQHYKTLVPMNRDQFRELGLSTWTENQILNASTTFHANIPQSYTDRFMNKFWETYSSTEAQAAIARVDEIIDLYFPAGRPAEIDDTPTEPVFVPDPEKRYYIDSPSLNLRLAATGESEDAYTTSTSTTGADVEWQFIQHPTGYWHIQRAAGGSVPRLRSDNSSLADMQQTSFSAGWTYYQFTEASQSDAIVMTLPDGPASFSRLQIANDGSVRMTTPNNASASTAFVVTEVSNIVHIRKRNATGFALDGNNGASNGQNVYLWTQNPNNVNQQWIEIDRGNGYFSYQKNNTNHCIDGGNGGAKDQNVYIWACNANNQNQHWLKVPDAGGAFRLIKRNAPGFLIDGGGGGAAGQNVDLFDNVNHPSQNLEWFITPISQ